jgi:outer membrane protein assembly factor BamD
MLSPAMITDKNHPMSILNTRKILILVCLAVIVSGCAGKKKTEDNLAQQQVEELYTKGKKALNSGNYSFATQYFRALEANYPYGEYTEQAKLDMIFAFNKSGQTDKTVEAAENFIKLYPTHKNVDYAYYMKGVASFERKKSSVDRFMQGGKAAIRDPKPYRDSEEAFYDLIKRYPQSIYTQDAKLRVIFIRNALAKRELAVAQFYFNSKTFVAAVNRCKTIIYKYETSPAVEGALVLMEKAYAEMGLVDLAKSTHGVLLENFPDYQRKPLETKKKGLLSRLNPF